MQAETLVYVGAVAKSKVPTLGSSFLRGLDVMFSPQCFLSLFLKSKLFLLLLGSKNFVVVCPVPKLSHALGQITEPHRGFRRNPHAGSPWLSLALASLQASTSARLVDGWTKRI